MSDRVAVVVVTYNRRELLERCLAAVQSQTLAPAAVVVVDNGSTDGTAELLAALSGGRGVPLRVVAPGQNLGGAGGFALGMERALGHEPTWLWLMDDDSVPDPDALQRLIDASGELRSFGGTQAAGDGNGRLRVGFLASRVLWTDGSPHVMNVPGRLTRGRVGSVSPGLQAVDYASFVSLLVSADAVWQCGLPVAEFFIGSDDVEYTWRLTRAGLRGFLVGSSRVRHLTPRNEGMDVWRLRVGPGEIEKWAIKTRNLVAVNRRRRWGWLREGLRVALLPLVWRLRGLGKAERIRLARAAREGLFWRYEPLIRFPQRPSESAGAPAADAA